MQASFFHENRQNLMNQQPGLLVLSGYLLLQNSADTAHSFLQEANFWYLTGINEPGWKIVLDSARNRSILVRPSTSSTFELFDGSLSSEDAMEISGVDEVISEVDFEPYLRETARRHTVAYTVYDKSKYEFVINPAQRDLYGILERIFSSVQLCNDSLKKLRAIKQPDEVSALKRAVDLTVSTFATIKDRLPDFSHEYEVEALFTYEFRRQGASHAYAPIVAAAKNACTLHYGKNNDRMQKKSLLLMDVGARVDGYAADITRTFAKGIPTKRQQDVHQAVEAAHLDIITLLEPGLPVEDYMRGVDERMKKALSDIGLLKDMSDNDTYRKYFPHAISHGLGVDVHDSLGGARYFEPGMVLTVEPGIYIPEEGIGVRIEDDILITKSGHENLSASLSTEM